MREIVFLLEEASAKVLLEGLLPRLIPKQIAARYIVFEGKQDLDKQLERKLRGYLNEKACFIIQKCRSAKRSAMVRIACRELEAFYLGDLHAVEQGFGMKGLSSKQQKEKYRNPDLRSSPSEELRKLTKGAYQKVSGSRAIAPHLNIESPRSPSFGHLLTAIRRCASK